MPWLFGPLILLELILPLPLKDNRGRHRGFPVATTALVVINVIVFGALLWAVQKRGADPVQLFQTFGVVPEAIMEREGLGALSVVTGGFLHSGLPHLLGNMFVLWFFGRKVEDLLGPVHFLLFYLLCLFGAGLTSAAGRNALSPVEAMIPAIGASGAISGVMAAYLFMYAGERITTLIIPIPWLFKLPAWVYIIYNFVHDVLLGLLHEQMIKTYGESPFGTDVFAHVGGLVIGLICVYLYLPPEALVDRRVNH